MGELQRKSDAQIEQLADELRQHIEAELQRDTAMAVKFEQMQSDIKEVNASVAEIANLLTQTKGAFAFVKMMAAVVATGAAAWAWLATNIHSITDVTKGIK